MRTDAAIGLTRTVAIIAKNLKTLWVSGAFKVTVHYDTGPLVDPPVLSASAVNVVNSQKRQQSLTAARTFTPISAYNLLFTAY